jgi:hypothetical protein
LAKLLAKWQKLPKIASVMGVGERDLSEKRSIELAKLAIFAKGMSVAKIAKR